MKIDFASPISFNSLEMYKKNNIKFPFDFRCRGKDKERTFYNISIKENKHIDGYEVKLTDDNHINPIAEQEMMIWPDIDYMFIDNMETDKISRGNGLGTCMHLTNIIEMMENNLQRIELLASSSAIPFHTKCGFKPRLNCSDNYGLANLRAIAYDDDPELAEYSQQAKELLKTRLNPKLKNKIASKIMLDYTKAAIKITTTGEQKYLFPHNVTMTLTRRDVLQNKNFYNKLFEKYQIDYQINDCSC